MEESEQLHQLDDAVVLMTDSWVTRGGDPVRTGKNKIWPSYRENFTEDMIDPIGSSN